MQKKAISPKISKLSFAICVPFRDNKEQKRTAHLETMVPHIEAILSHCKASFHIYIIEQSDDKRKFNRGKLLNVGFDLAIKNGHKYCIFHDVDMIPDVELIKYYMTFPYQPIHLADTNPKYPFPNYFGGIQSFSVKDYQKINGYPNNFWGWGGEDDETLKRVKDSKLKILKPSSGSFTEIEHGWNSNDGIPKEEKKKLLHSHHHTWKKNGLNNLIYQVLSKEQFADFTTRVLVKI